MLPCGFGVSSLIRKQLGRGQFVREFFVTGFDLFESL
jgi:hypothetical protein